MYNSLKKAGMSDTKHYIKTHISNCSGTHSSRKKEKQLVEHMKVSKFETEDKSKI